MRITLRETDRSEALVFLETALPPFSQPQSLLYRTRVGALATLDGVTAGAFDREHDAIELPASARERTLRLAVEREGLPTNGLPPGDDIRWRWMLFRAHPEPQRYVDVRPSATRTNRARVDGEGITLWGHSHLDVAWLWTYAQSARKAVRTFANALTLLDDDPSFIFMQSQPQLYAFVSREDPELFARVLAEVARGRFDADVAAMWVEPDCNVPSGESLLRQLLFAHAYCAREFGVEPSIAWLPDTFGFARTLPTLLAHAGIKYFATTKLQWNDTTRFPYPQFRWRGPDGSEITSALIASYDGGPDAGRLAVARERSEPMVVGYGDGGGGPTRRHLEQAETIGTWQRPREWFEALDARRETLPVHDDELYLEYHRGVFTTHHDIKSFNAALERALAEAEEQLAWCTAVRAPAATLERLRASLAEAWTIVLRNQFHDVLPGTSIHAVYEDARAEYQRAADLIESVATSAKATLPRAPRYERAFEIVEPVRGDGEFTFDNGLLRALVSERGVVTELATAGGSNVAAQVNLLAAYRDRPRKWEAWNIDAGYERHPIAVKPQGADIVDGALEVRFRIGASPATMRIALHDGEPFLRVDLAVDWRERRTLLRCEHWLTLQTDRVTYGAPHGVVERSARRDTPQERARYEVPGQRFADVRDGRGGFAAFALDTYGWNARALPKGGLHLGHSLLRSTTWPDPTADQGEARLSWALAPHGAGVPIGTLERAWEQFAHERRVRLFTCEDDALLVVATKPAHDGDGVIVRVRECNGAPRELRLRSGGRMREAIAVDALERPVDGEVRIEGEALVAAMPGFGLRTFRVRF